MALTPSTSWLRDRKPLIFISCFVLVVSFFSLHKPVYVAFYKWKEPHFAMPVYLRDDIMVLRNDDWGEGHFGAKRKGGRLHKGIDIKAEVGTVVYASKSGRAVCGNVPKGMGRYVKIKHPDGLSTVYGHLKDWVIESDSWVRQGQIIGLVGKSGNADIEGINAHLHFEIRDGGTPINPKERIRKVK